MGVHGIGMSPGASLGEKVPRGKGHRARWWTYVGGGVLMDMVSMG